MSNTSSFVFLLLTEISPVLMLREIRSAGVVLAVKTWWLP